jgi:hypothetical protein
MTGDHHAQTAGRATMLVRAVDEILGTHRIKGYIMNLRACPDGTRSPLSS